MAWIQPVRFNMDYSNAILEGNHKNPIVSAIQKIALFLIIPFALIVFTEAVLKNMIIYNSLNMGILIINKVHQLFVSQTDKEAAAAG